MDGIPKKFQMKINSVDITDYVIKQEMTKTRDTQIKTAAAIVSKQVEDILETDDLIGLSAEIYRGETTATEFCIIRGQVVNVQSYGGRYEIKIRDKLYETTKQTITYTYDKDIDPTAGKISAIFKDIIENYTDLECDDTTIQDSGTTYLLKKFICKEKPVFCALTELAKILNWIFYYNSQTNKVYFEPQGTENNSSTLETKVNIVEPIKWQIDEKNMFNIVRIDGAFQEAQTEESGQIGSTDGYTTSYIQLGYTPIATRVLCDSSNPPTTERRFGVPRSTTDYDYYVDKDKKRIIWNTDSYTPGSSDYVIVQYTYMKPVPIEIDDEESKEKYGEKKIVLTQKDIDNVDDVETYAKHFLETHKDPLISATIRITDVKDIEPGQKIKIIDEENNIDDYFYVLSVIQKYPYVYDTISVVNKLITTESLADNILKRIERLEKEQNRDFEFLTYVKQFSNNIYPEEKYLKIVKRDLSAIASSSFILGHPRFGKLGSSPLGQGSGTITETTMAIVRANGIYTELFDSTEFKDSTNTTATWDTANEKCTIDTGETAQSIDFVFDKYGTDNWYKKVKIIAEGSNLKQLSFYIGENTNSSIVWTQVEMSGRNSYLVSEWNTITEVNNKYGLRWKIYNSGTTSAEITKLVIKFEV